MCVLNRPYHGFRRHFDEQAKRVEITVFVLESDGKYLLQKLNSGQLMNCKVKILGKSFYSPSLKDVAALEGVQLRFLFSIHLSIFFSA